MGFDRKKFFSKKSAPRTDATASKRFVRKDASSSRGGRDSDKPRDRDRVFRKPGADADRPPRREYARAPRPDGDRPPRREFSSRPSYGSSDRGPPRRSFDRDSEERQSYEVTCAACGKRTDVPFKPTGSKPVYCRDCFRKQEISEGDTGASPTSRRDRQLEEINKKLDAIMKALKID